MVILYFFIMHRIPFTIHDVIRGEICYLYPLLENKLYKELCLFCSLLYFQYLE